MKAQGDSDIERKVDAEEAGHKQELDPDDIQTADARIDLMHPLSATPLYKVFPWLCCLGKYLCKKDEDEFDEEEEKEKENKRDEI